MELFHISFIKFTLADLIDVALVAFLFYRVLILMKGTRSAQIVLGVFLLFFISFLAFWFRLEGLTWLITNIATVGILVLVIVFQPELRNALAQIGHNKLFRLFFRYEKSKTLDELVRAAIRLSQMRYGGLLIIEREIGLKDLIETGKALNAEVSADLLVTIFTPYTPLHDGAAIVQGDYVVAVACTLPLSQNPRYGKLFGMRHKAAIGVTEESDAIAVVVSEETGKISIAYKGVLYQNIDKSTLKEKLVKMSKSG
ncbi:MAG: diadenylate cyclase CdaA [Candidatus Zixiibacteriota bacterium]|nr:MAG: diadenylate cyclase CdaA [candidate division Zixibacteria bacterium]